MNIYGLHFVAAISLQLQTAMAYLEPQTEIPAQLNKLHQQQLGNQSERQEKQLPVFQPALQPHQYQQTFYPQQHQQQQPIFQPYKQVQGVVSQHPQYVQPQRLSSALAKLFLDLLNYKVGWVNQVTRRNGHLTYPSLTTLVTSLAGVPVQDLGLNTNGIHQHYGYNGEAHLYPYQINPSPLSIQQYPPSYQQQYPIPNQQLYPIYNQQHTPTVNQQPYNFPNQQQNPTVNQQPYHLPTQQQNPTVNQQPYHLPTQQQNPTVNQQPYHLPNHQQNPTVNQQGYHLPNHQQNPNPIINQKPYYLPNQQQSPTLNQNPYHITNQQQHPTTNQQSYKPPQQQHPTTNQQPYKPPHNPTINQQKPPSSEPQRPHVTIVVPEFQPNPFGNERPSVPDKGDIDETQLDLSFLEIEPELLPKPPGLQQAVIDATGSTHHKPHPGHSHQSGQPPSTSPSHQPQVTQTITTITPPSVDLDEYKK